MIFTILGGWVAIFVRHEMQLKAFGIVIGFALLVALLEYLGRLHECYRTHEPCPKCGENDIKKIKRVPSGYQDDGSIDNPITIEFDEKRDMYVRRYNRICPSCRYRYYVDEGRWPKGSLQGEPKLSMTREFREQVQRDVERPTSKTR